MSEVFTRTPHGRLKNRCEPRNLDRQHVQPQFRLRVGFQVEYNLGQAHKALGRWHFTESYGSADDL